MKPEDFIITCKKCGSTDVRIVCGNISYVIITKIKCGNKDCKHVEQI